MACPRDRFFAALVSLVADALIAGDDPRGASPGRVDGELRVQIRAGRGDGFRCGHLVRTVHGIRRSLVDDGRRRSDQASETNPACIVFSVVVDDEGDVAGDAKSYAKLWSQFRIDWILVRRD